MNYPDLKLKCRDKDLSFRFLGKFEIEKDEQGYPIILRGEENCLLSIQTKFTKSSELEAITIIPDFLKEKLSRNYYDTKRLEDIWKSPGVYAFVLIQNDKTINDLECKYIGRASSNLIERLRGYLAPGPCQSTNVHVNNLIFNSLKKGDKVFVYFFPEQDTEKELHRSLKPEWNREK